MREPNRKIKAPNRLEEIQKTVVSTLDWSNIPYYPTNREKRIELANRLLRENKVIPPTLLQKIKEDEINELRNDSYPNNKIEYNNTNNTPIREPVVNHNTYNTIDQNSYSVNVKPKATASARIRLGGVY